MWWGYGSLRVIESGSNITDLDDISYFLKASLGAISASAWDLGDFSHCKHARMLDTLRSVRRGFKGG